MCVDLSWTVDQADGVWFVSCLLSNPTDVTRRVRLDSCLDGPVLPPRRRGVPEPGWDATGVTLSLESGERRGVGFACPVPPNNTTDEGDTTNEDRIDDGDDADDEDGPDRATAPTDPPVAITDCAPADSDEPVSSETAAAAVRRLGDHRPPRAVVADVPADATATTTTASTTATATNETPPTADTALHATIGGGDDDGQPVNGVTGFDPVAASAAWLDAVEERVERAEQLTDADLETATTVLERTGGAAAAVDLARRVDADDEDGPDRATAPTDPPVAITDCAPADSDEPVSSETAAAAVRRLGDHRPPRAVVADVPADATATTTTASTTATATNETPPTADTALHATIGGGTDDSRPANGVTGSGAVAASATWLDAVEERVERAEQLTDADLKTATTVLERTGGAAAAVDLARRVDADASQLRRLADRASSLAARAAATDVPVEPLESLA